MGYSSTVFNQVLSFIPPGTLRSLTDQYKTDRYSKHFDTKSQLLVNIFAHATQSKSLRAIETSLRSWKNVWYHLSLKNISRSHLSYMNKKRDYRLFKDLFTHMLVEFQKKLPKAKFRFKNPLKILDSTTIPLCLSLFPWARYRKRKGALKIHTMLDGDHTLPVLMDITEGRVSDIKRARKMTESLSQDSILTMDLGYIDYGWLCELHLRHITFVTRSKKNMDFEDLGQHVEPHEKGVMSDRIILLSGYNSFKKYPHRMRRVTFFDEETEKELAFITNNLVLSAKTIAVIYKRRWDIENFFKWIKQNLKIKTFLGSSENAVLIQIWTAMIYYLILKYIQLQTKYAFSMLNLTRVVCSTLFKNVHMIDLLNLSPNGFKPPGYDGQQMLLFDG